LLASCESSVHDLSRVELSGAKSPVPRFNMPFELGISVAQKFWTNERHKFFLFEDKAHRLQRSLSDINGVDPHAHGGKPLGVLRELGDAFPRRGSFRQPTTTELVKVHRLLRKAACRLKDANRARSVFTTHLCLELVLAA